MSNVILPELGEGVETATVAEWSIKVGDKVRKEEDIVELVTDKASFCVPATVNGIITEILVPEGKEAKIGDILAVIGKENDK